VKRRLPALFLLNVLSSLVAPALAQAAPQLLRLTCEPTTVPSQGSTTCTALLTEAVAVTTQTPAQKGAPAFVVKLAWPGSEGSIQILAGAKQGSAPVALHNDGVDNKQVSIEATAGGLSRSASVTVLGSILQSLAIVPDHVSAVAGATGTVTLNAPAPSGGIQVKLTAADAALRVPGSVVVPAGSAQVEFPVSTPGVSATVDTALTATAAFQGDSDRVTAAVRIDRVDVLKNLTVSPGGGGGGIGGVTPYHGTVTLSAPAPPAGIKVKLSGDAPEVASLSTAASLVNNPELVVVVPDAVTVGSGLTEATFEIAVRPVAHVTDLTLHASSDAFGSADTATADIHVRAPNFESLYPISGYTYGMQVPLGGVSVTMRARFSSAIGHGAVIGLAYTNSAVVTGPLAVAIPDFQNSVDFLVKLLPCDAQTCAAGARGRLEGTQEGTQTTQAFGFQLSNPAAQGATSSAATAAAPPSSAGSATASTAAANAALGKSSAPAAAVGASALWEIKPNGRGGRLGRLVVAYPDAKAAEGASLAVRKPGDENAVSTGYGDQTIDLLPGTYDVAISGKLVAGVPIQSGSDTRVKVGILAVHANAGTRVDIVDPVSKKAVIDGYGDKSYGLPVGTVNVTIAGQSEAVTIEDGKVSDF